MRQVYYRQYEIKRLSSELEASGFPRLKMLFIVALTGGVGFLASFLMLRCGVTSMAFRYPIAVGIAYLIFLFFLWLWLRTTADDYGGLDGSGNISAPCNDTATCCEAPIVADDGGATGEALGAVAQAEEFAIPLLAVLIVGAILLSSLWVVYSAPMLFAELMVDGVLAASLYRRLRGLETRHWLITAIRRTVWPFAITALAAGAGGAGLHVYAPKAHSLGEAIHSHVQSDG